MFSYPFLHSSKLVHWSPFFVNSKKQDYNFSAHPGMPQNSEPTPTVERSARRLFLWHISIDNSSKQLPNSNPACPSRINLRQCFCCSGCIRLRPLPGAHCFWPRASVVDFCGLTLSCPTIDTAGQIFSNTTLWGDPWPKSCEKPLGGWGNWQIFIAGFRWSRKNWEDAGMIYIYRERERESWYGSSLWSLKGYMVYVPFFLRNSDSDH